MRNHLAASPSRHHPRMRAVPGVESAALVTSPPLFGMDIGASFNIVGETKDGEKPHARVSAVSGPSALAHRPPKSPICSVNANRI